MWKELTVRCEAQIKGYPSTDEKDEELLKTDLTENQRNCVRLRLGEKLIFQYLIDTAATFLKILFMTKKEANL